jgi:hypothetical protein
MSEFNQVLERAHNDSAFRGRLLRDPLRALASYELSTYECGVLHTLLMSAATARRPRRVATVSPAA